MTEDYEGRRARMAEMLAVLGRDHNEFSSRELTLMQAAWDAAHDRFAPLPDIPYDEPLEPFPPPDNTGNTGS